ncbi:MAG: hypothetical protein RR505_03035, partial [Raoultibacter sp.]
RSTDALKLPSEVQQEPLTSSSTEKGTKHIPKPSLDRFSSVLLVFGFLFSWLYIAKGFFKESYFGAIESVDGVLAYCFFLAVLIGFTMGASVFKRKFVRLLQHHRVVCALGLFGSLSLLLTRVVLGYFGHVLAPVLCVVFLVVFALGFVVVFFSWIIEIRELMFSQRLNTIVVLMLVAMALAYVIVPSNLNNSDYRTVLPIASLGLSAICYLLYVRRSGGLISQESLEKCSVGSEGPARRTWLIPLFLLALTISLISYVEVFIPGYRVITNESLLSYSLPFVLSLILALIAVQSGRTPFFQNKLFWHACLGFLALIFLSFFVAVFVLAVQTNFCFEVMYLIRRMTKIMFFVIFMVIIYQEDLNPSSVFGGYYIVPLFVPCLLINVVQLFLSNYAPETLALIGEFAVGYALFLGFCLILCLVFVCVMFVNGSIAKIAFSPSRHDMDRDSTSRGDLCDRIGDDFGLT